MKGRRPHYLVAQGFSSVIARGGTSCAGLKVRLRMPFGTLIVEGRVGQARDSSAQKNIIVAKRVKSLEGYGRWW